jgi:hypothetical protein
MAGPLMKKPTIDSQWDPGNFKPLDMSKILGYPRQMPPMYENWLSRFTSNDGVIAEDHMDNFGDFFQLHPISNDFEYLGMKLLSATLHGNARKWYDNLPDSSITSMDQLEETFLKKWNIKIEDICVLIKRLEYMKQTGNETVKEFHTRSENLLHQIPRIHHPEDRYPAYLYTNALLVHLGFLLNKKRPKSIQEACDIATQIKENISLFKKEHLFTLETKLITPKMPQMLLVWKD